MGPEYSWAFRPELARNWSAAPQGRFSMVTVVVSFAGVAIQRKKPLLDSMRANAELTCEWRVGATSQVERRVMVLLHIAADIKTVSYLPIHYYSQQLPLRHQRAMPVLQMIVATHQYARGGSCW